MRRYNYDQLDLRLVETSGYFRHCQCLTYLHVAESSNEELDAKSTPVLLIVAEILCYTTIWGTVYSEPELSLRDVNNIYFLAVIYPCFVFVKCEILMPCPLVYLTWERFWPSHCASPFGCVNAIICRATGCSSMTKGVLLFLVFL